MGVRTGAVIAVFRSEGPVDFMRVDKTSKAHPQTQSSSSVAGGNA